MTSACVSWVTSGTLGLTKPWRIQRPQQRLISQHDRYIPGKGICQGHSEHHRHSRHGWGTQRWPSTTDSQWQWWETVTQTLSFLSDEYSGHFLMAQCHPHFDSQAYTGLRICPEWPGSIAGNPTLKNLRQEHCRFDASLAYIARVTRKETYPSCSKTTVTGKQSRSPTVRKQQELVCLFFQIIWEINFNLNLTFFKIEVTYEGELHPSK